MAKIKSPEKVLYISLTGAVEAQSNKDSLHGWKSTKLMDLISKQDFEDTDVEVMHYISLVHYVVRDSKVIYIIMKHQT